MAQPGTKPKPSRRPGSRLSPGWRKRS